MAVLVYGEASLESSGRQFLLFLPGEEHCLTEDGQAVAL